MSHLPEDPKSRAVRLLRRGRPRAALAVTTVGLCRDSDAAGLWLLRASIHHDQRQWQKALADIEHAMTLIPLPVSGQVVLADCYWFTGRRELALIAYEHLLTAEAEKPEVYAAVYAGLVRCKRRDLALRCCRVAVESNPDDHAAMFAMAHCMVALNYDATYVATILRQAVQAAPDRDVYRLSLAIQLTRSGCCEDAYEQVAATPISQLSKMTCACSISRLLSVCVKAGDTERASALAARLRQLDAAAKGDHEA